MLQMLLNLVSVMNKKLNSVHIEIILLPLFCSNINILSTISDISNDVWNSISETLPIVLSRYQDLKSQSYVKEFIKVLMISKPEACLVNLTPILAEYVNQYPHFNIS